MNNTKIYNGTPHSVNIVEGAVFDPSIRKYKGGEVVKVYPSNGMLNAVLERQEIEMPELGNVVVMEQKILGVDKLPENYDTYIVSALYANSYRKMYGSDGVKLLTIADTVVNDDLKILGCNGFILN